MRYIITESKLEQAITDYLYEIFPIDDIHWLNPDNYNYQTREEYEDETIVVFYFGDYEDGETTIFKWYDCEHFYPNSHGRNICPTVSLELKYERILNSFFGELWKEPFKKWFMENFDLSVKTVNN